MIDLNKIEGVHIPEKQYTLEDLQFDLGELLSSLFDVLRCDSEGRPLLAYDHQLRPGFQKLYELVYTISKEISDYIVEGYHMNPEDTERRLVRVSLEFAEIVESTTSEIKKIALEVQKTGKPLEEIKVGELLSFAYQHMAEYGQIHSLISGEEQPPCKPETRQEGKVTEHKDITNLLNACTFGDDYITSNQELYNYYCSLCVESGTFPCSYIVFFRRLYAASPELSYCISDKRPAVKGIVIGTVIFEDDDTIMTMEIADDDRADIEENEQFDREWAEAEESYFRSEWESENPEFGFPDEEVPFPAAELHQMIKEGSYRSGGCNV